MRRSSRKMLIVGALTLAALAGPVAGAGAAPLPSLTITPATDTFTKQSNNVAVTGNAAVDGFVVAYAEATGTDCATNAMDESFRDVVTIGTGNDLVAAGAISLNLTWAPFLAASHVICGYLYEDGADISLPPVGTSGPTTIVVKAANTDNDGDGVPNDVDECPSVAGTLANGCPPPAQQPVTPVTPVTPVVPGGLPTPVANVPAAPADPTGVLKLKSSKGKATACGAGCLVRTRTVGPFSFSLKVKVKGATTKETASVVLRTKTAQAGQAGKVCVSSYSTKLKLTCKKITWAVGRKVTLTGSIATPAKIGAGSRPGFAVTAYVGRILVGSGASLYLKSAGGHIVPDTNESACAASAGAHAAC